MIFSYKDSGVDTHKAADYLKNLKGKITSTYSSCSQGRVVPNFGSFAGLFQTALSEDTYLTAATDGVGTKIQLAREFIKFSGLGQDLVAMCSNDIYCVGGTPLFFLDYINCESLEEAWYNVIISGVVDSCKEVGMALLGGETAEHPGIATSGDFDLAGFCVGMVHKKQVLPKLDEVEEGDQLIGIPSSGFHSNGFSLIRKILSHVQNLKKETPLKELIEDRVRRNDLLTPTRLYRDLPQFYEDTNIRLKGIAHITGGGLYENIHRIIPSNYVASISYPLSMVPNIMKLFFPYVNPTELFSTFNMGTGVVLCVSSSTNIKDIQKVYPNSQRIGLITSLKAKKEDENSKFRVEILNINNFKVNQV